MGQTHRWIRQRVTHRPMVQIDRWRVTILLTIITNSYFFYSFYWFSEIEILGKIFTWKIVILHSDPVSLCLYGMSGFGQKQCLISPSFPWFAGSVGNNVPQWWSPLQCLLLYLFTKHISHPEPEPSRWMVGTAKLGYFKTKLLWLSLC